MIRAMIASAHMLERAAIRSLVQSVGDVQVLAETANDAQALALIDAHEPDIILMDIDMAVRNSLDAARAIKQRFPSVYVVILSMHANEAYVEKALLAGASGYLLKDMATSKITCVIETVMRNEIYLDAQVAMQLAQALLARCRTCSDKQKPASGQTDLTSRQREILRNITLGRGTKEIARSLGISHKTVEAHRTQIMARLDIHDIPGLVRYAIRTGLIDLE